MSETVARPGFLLPAYTLWRRELTRFFRQRSRLIGAIMQPLFFWLLFGIAFQASFQVPAAAGDLSYMEFFFPGTIALIVLFSAIFSTISIIEDRAEGFLQAVLVARGDHLAHAGPPHLLGLRLGVLVGRADQSVRRGIFADRTRRNRLRDARRARICSGRCETR